MIRRISAAGLKGGDGSLDLEPVTVVTGPNGFGKSAVIDAIRFVSGVGEVCGVSPNGPGLKAALRGPLTVTAETDRGVLCRTRGVSDRRATWTAGAGLDDWAMHADVVSGLLAGSPDSVEVALAVVGAAVSRVGPDAVSRRDATAEAVAKAHAERRRAEDAAETSRKASGDATPDAEARARAALAEATAAYDEAAATLARHEAALAAYARAETRRAELANLEQFIAGAVEVDLETPRAFLADAQAEETAAAEAYQAAKLESMAAQAHAQAAAERDTVCASGSCPTCGQAVGSDVQIATADARRVAVAACEAAVAVVAAAGSRLSDARTDRRAWAQTVAQGEEARTRVESARQQAAWLREQLAETPPPASPDVVEIVRVTALQRQRARKDAEAALAAAVRGHERYRRWRADLAVRDQVEARLEEAKAAHAAAMADLEQLVRVGAVAVREAVAELLPAAWPVAYVEGRFGLQLGPHFVTGAGLSGAQRALLGAALDYCAAAIVARNQREPIEAPPFMLEADALDAGTLSEVLVAVADLVAAKKLPQAIIATCHPVPAGPWHVIDLGGNPATSPEPVPERAKWPAPGFSLSADEAPAPPPVAAEPEAPPPPPDDAQPSLFDAVEGDFVDEFDGGYAPAEAPADSLEEVWPTPPAPVQSPGISEVAAAALLAGTSAAAVRALWAQFGGGPPEKATLTTSRAFLAGRMADTWAHPDEVRVAVERAKAAHPKRKAQTP